MASRIIIFLALALIGTNVAGFRNVDLLNQFGAGYPFRGGLPMDFVAPQVHFPFNFPHSFPKIPPVKLPSKEEILNFKPRPGQTYQGVVVESTNDGSKFVVNDNGVVVEKIIPNSVNEQNINEPFPDYFKPLDVNNVRSFVASPNTVGQASMVMSSSSYINDNGKESSSGGIHTIVNDGKTVKETSYRF